jgi:hypothetical protein
VSEQALLSRLVAALDAAGVPYMLTGSLASSAQGVPRASHDVDIVISVTSDDAPRLLSALAAPDLYVDDQAVGEALRLATTFNVIDPGSGDKADFWLLKDEPYDRERFARRTVIEALGLHLVVSAPEDTILMKLRWSALGGGSQKQLDDAAGVYEFQVGELDEEYLDLWAARLGVTEALAELRRLATGT